MKIQGLKGPFYIDKIKRKGYRTMETIKINQEKRAYEIKSIMQISPHVLQVVFAETEEVPAKYGDIQVYTAGGICCVNLPGYSTVYRDEGKTVYLSDDGSVYKPPQEPEQDPSELYEPTEQEKLEYAKEAKRNEVSSACEQAIYKGVSVTLSDGTVEHYSLTEHDQINLFGKQAQLVAGAVHLEYHADGQPCRYYSAADMQTIIRTAMWHVSYHTTYCNALNIWIASCQTADEVQQIFYGIDIPLEYRSEVLNTYLIQIESVGEEKENETAS